MPRCGCASDQCACNIVAGDNVTVSGTGSKNNPFVVSSATKVVDESGTPIESPGTGRLTGEIIAYGGQVAPDGWLLCNGQELNRAVYGALFSVIGTAYGAGDGAVTFNAPDFTGRFPRGEDGSSPRGTSGGDDGFTLTAANLPAHRHAIDHDHAAFNTGSGGEHTHSAPTSHNDVDGSNNATYREGSSAGDSAIGDSGAHTHSVNVPPYAGLSGSTGNGTEVPFSPPFASVVYLVKS